MNMIPAFCFQLSFRYSLAAVTHGNGLYFVSSILFQGQWWLCDGMQPNRLSKRLNPSPPQGYRSSYAIYVQE